MGILRADIVSHSQLQPTGSVAFDGTTDYLTIPASSAWFSGLANSTVKKSFTVEWWQYWNAVSGYVDLLDVNYTAGLLLEAANGKYTVYAGGGSQGVEATAAVTGQWYHYALVFYSGAPLAPGSIVLYRDGEVSASGNVAGNVAVGNSSTVLSIGAKQSNGAYSLNGYISNFRWCDRVVYNAPFTPPKFELTAIAGTQLLCCQSSSSVTEAAVIPGGLSITANGNAAASAFAPDIKKDNTDTGVVLEDNTKFDTLSYMVPPGGTTTQRGRGRAVMSGFYEGPSTYYTNIEYLNIQSLGNTIKFGDLTLGSNLTEIAACSSSTRALFAGGTTPGGGTGGTKLNIIHYVTIATTGNSVDFGDLTAERRTLGGCSNETRGIFGGGIDDPARLNTIDYVTIASAGNGADFGDLSEQRRNISAHSSTTRGIFAGGLNPGPAYVNTIDYITIATTGDATNFGDLTALVYATTSCSNSTRGVIMGGTNPSGATNVINYVTIASTGDAVDFGDLTVARSDGAGVASPTRGLMIGGETPSNDYNTIDYVTIATAGNASDFGDVSVGIGRGQAGSSDCHGGIS